MTVEAALNTVEFRLRENNTGSFPRGIVFMLRALRDWLHGRDPLSPLAFEGPLAAVKARVAGGERFFEDMIRRHFLDNRHRTVLILRPDREQAEREAEEERARLEQARAAMTRADLEAAVDATHALKRAQETPDSPEALATIPTLKLADLPRRNKLVPIEIAKLRDVPVLYHDLFTNGVVYLDLGFDLHRLPAELLPYVTLFGRALLETGAGDDDFVRLSQRIGSATGGIRPQRWTSTIPGAATCAAWFHLRGKALPGQTGELSGDPARHPDRRAARQPRPVPPTGAGGEGRARSRGWCRWGRAMSTGGCASNFHEADWADEQMGGISYLFFLRKLAARRRN